MTVLGDRVLALVRGASSEVTLISPFIKCDALWELTSAVLSKVSLRCVTRWRPEELARGVTDLDAWPLLRERRASLALRDDLHAKVYIADDRCLVGSANLTGAGFGWTDPHNLEVLVEVPANHPDIVGLQRLLAESICVDDDLYRRMSELVDGRLAGTADAEAPCVAFRAGSWLPVTRSPELLFEAYAGRADTLPSATRAAAARDLAVIPVRPGLERRLFESAVAVWLLQSPLIASVDRFVDVPRRFGEVSDYLGSRLDGGNPDAAWQTLMRWLRHFWPSRYVLAQPNYTEVFVKASVLLSAVGGTEKPTDATAASAPRRGESL